MTTRSPVIATVLSLVVPGLGQLYNGERAKGLAMVCMTLGIGLSAALSRSMISWILLGAVYLVVLVPAAQDASRVAKGLAPSLTGERPWYVIWMLLVVGPFAFPLLWQSRRFSQRTKLILTIVVIIVALLGILVIGAMGPLLEGTLQRLSPLKP